jgi:hypothetical protein
LFIFYFFISYMSLVTAYFDIVFIFYILLISFFHRYWRVKNSKV